MNQCALFANVILSVSVPGRHARSLNNAGYYVLEPI